MDRSRAVRIAIGVVAIGVVAIGVVAIGVVAIGAVLVVAGSRRAGSPAAPAAERSPDWLRAFVSRRFNPVVLRLGLVGGRRSPWALLEHTGRRSGTAYRTPVLPMVVGDHAFVPLPYGEDVNWVRNVRAAGHCRLQRHGELLELDEPAVVGAAEHPGIPAWSRGTLERRGRRYLRLHVLATVAGTLEPAVGTGTGATETVAPDEVPAPA